MRTNRESPHFSRHHRDLKPCMGVRKPRDARWQPPLFPATQEAAWYMTIFLSLEGYLTGIRTPGNFLNTQELKIFICKTRQY